MNFLDLQTVQKELIHPKKSFKKNSSCADIVLYSISRWKIENPSLLLNNSTSMKKILITFSDKFWLDIQLRWGDFDSHDIERYCRSKFLEYTSDSLSVYPCITGAVISVDLAYNIFSGYGYWFKNLKFFIYKSLLKIIKINPSLHVLRERIRKSLQLFKSESNQPSLDLENYISLFSKKGTWLFDDSSFYRVSLHQSREGNVIIKPINGVLFVFSSEDGKMFFRIIHKSYWQAQKRLSQLAKWKSSEEIVKLIKYISLEQKPREIVVLRKKTINSLTIHMIEFPDIIIKGSLIKIPFRSLIKINRIKKLINRSSFCNLLVFNLYDNWLKTISTFTAFSRLLLILKAIKINLEEVRIIFNQFENLINNNNYLWPDITDEKWMKLEIALKDIIIDNYCYQKKVNPKILNQNDIRLIILGSTSNSVCKSDSRDKINSIVSDSTKIINSTDNLGKNLMISVTFKKVQGNFVSFRNWEYSSIFGEKQNLLLKNIKVEYSVSTLKNKVMIIPNNIIKHFLMITNPIGQTIGLIFGFYKNTKTKIYEIRVLIIPPQIYTRNLLSFKNVNIKQKILLKLNFFGFMLSTSYIEISLIKLKKLTSNLCKICIANDISSTFNLITININFYNYLIQGIQIANFKEGGEFLKQKKIQILITDRFFGIFLVPEDKKWNYFFKPLIFENLKKCNYILDLPYSFFNYIHYV